MQKKYLRDRRDPHTSPDSVNYRPARRRCLACGEAFDSEGPHNRRCGKCKHALQHGRDPDHGAFQRSPP